jgi:cadmium resistance protein CadD (predicted permease)
MTLNHNTYRQQYVQHVIYTVHTVCVHNTGDTVQVYISYVIISWHYDLYVHMIQHTVHVTLHVCNTYRTYYVECTITYCCT